MLASPLCVAHIALIYAIAMPPTSVGSHIAYAHFVCACIFRIFRALHRPPTLRSR
ncbi:hypothetical protein BDZ91DRAFT_711777 [Kalaharituber pfeilii]|nr:hypothetical protein BDZ91DRAFT_711777 [Kalaharituber pfeilii]